MNYYTPNEINAELEKYPELKESLYCRGFLITTKKIDKLDAYPFYGNWREEIISFRKRTIYFYLHKYSLLHFVKEGEQVFFLVGHAYDPFSISVNEKEILTGLANARKKDDTKFIDLFNNLTGVFCFGVFSDNDMQFTTDCGGMQLVNYGKVKNEIFISSHSKLVADINHLKQPKYVQRLVDSKYWKYFGNWMPGDWSGIEELKRAVPNFIYQYDFEEKVFVHKRFYPIKQIVEIKSEDEYQALIEELCEVVQNTMLCISKKWPEKKVSISVTGGRDSLTALAASNNIYDRFSYFSYISKEDEAIDAKAANTILKNLELEHEVIEIPENSEEYVKLELFKKILECNAGCIGTKHLNDIKKRLLFFYHPPCDIEVKSWMNEMGRGWYQNKFNKDKFPRYPYPAYWRAMHKVYTDPYLIHETNKVFKDYLKDFYSKEIFDMVDWKELYFWEFAWSGGEGVFLTAEHRVSYDITIPFNNRKYIDLLLKVPIEKRKNDDIPNDMIEFMEQRISETGISIKDLSHTDKRANLERLHLEFASKLVF